jgi:hypothetical protein
VVILLLTVALGNVAALAVRQRLLTRRRWAVDDLELDAWLAELRTWNEVRS